MRHIYSLLKKGFLLISRVILAIKRMFLHNDNVFRIILGGMVRMFRHGNLLQFHSFIIVKTTRISEAERDMDIVLLYRI